MLRVDDFLSSLSFSDENPRDQDIPETISRLLSHRLREYSRPWLLQRKNGNSATTPIASSSSQNGTSSDASQLIAAISQPTLRS